MDRLSIGLLSLVQLHPFILHLLLKSQLVVPAILTPVVLLILLSFKDFLGGHRSWTLTSNWFLKQLSIGVVQLFLSLEISSLNHAILLDVQIIFKLSFPASL
jgi:hypothetical protein